MAIGAFNKISADILATALGRLDGTLFAEFAITKSADLGATPIIGIVEAASITLAGSVGNILAAGVLAGG